MNKYTARGLAEAASKGCFEIIVVTRHPLSAMEEIPPHFYAAATSVSRANGKERVDFASGGSISFLHPGSDGHRGRQADVLYLDSDIPHTEHDALIKDYRPCIQTSPIAEIIRP